MTVEIQGRESEARRERGAAVQYEDTAVLREICMHLEMYNAKH